MANIKYEITDITKRLRSGQILHRIRALRQIGNIEAGVLGGWIESEANLSQDGDCWVYATAMVYDDARVCDNASIKDNSRICGQAVVKDNARIVRKCMITDQAIVEDDTKVCDSHVHGHAKICGNAYLSRTQIDNYCEIGGHSVCCDCSIFDYAKVYDNAYIKGKYYNTRFLNDVRCKIYGYAHVHQNATITDCAHIYENAHVGGTTKIQNNAKIHGNAHVCDNAICKDDADVSGFSLIDGDKIVSAPIADDSYKTSKETYQLGGSVWILDMDENRNYAITERIFICQQGAFIISADLFQKPLDLNRYLELIAQEHRHNIQMDHSYKCYLSFEAATLAMCRLPNAGKPE